MSYEKKHPQEAAVIKLCNEHRQEHGVGPLKPSKRLRVAAHAHAKDMMERNYFEHNTKGGASWHVRIKRVVGQSYATIAENIAYGQDDPAAVVSAWMDSPGHRKNILDPNYTYMGLGLHSRGSTEYWVQDFGGN